MRIPLFPSVQLKPSLSLSLTHMQTNMHTHNHRPLPLVPYALLCPVPFAKEGGNPPGAHSSWPCWPPVVNDALGGPQTRVCVGRGGGDKEEAPHFPLATHSRRPATRDPQHAKKSAVGTGSGGQVLIFWEEQRRIFESNFRSHAQALFSLLLPHPTFFFFSFFYWGANSEPGESSKIGTKMPGQPEHFVFVALPRIDPTLGIYSRCKYQGGSSGQNK